MSDLLALAMQMKSLAEQIIAKAEAAPSNEPPPEYVTMADFAARTRYSPRTIRHYVAMGMPSAGTGRARKIKLAAALAWIERGGPTIAAATMGKRAAKGGEVCR